METPDPNDFELSGIDWAEVHYENKAANATRRARAEGYITAEEAKEQSPYGWWICERCGWDGSAASLDMGTFKCYCPECGEDLST